MHNRNYGQFGGSGGYHGMMPSHGMMHHHFQNDTCPPQVGPTQYDPPQVSPTREMVRTNVMNTVVPHIHPSHTTTVNKHVIHNQHYFPHTESVVNECYETNTICGMPQKGCCHPRHWGRR